MADHNKGGVATASKGAEQTKDTARDVMGAASEVAGQVKDKVQEWGSAAVEGARDLGVAAAEKASDFGKEVSHLIRRHPVEALLIGAGVGLGVGLLLGRGSRS